MKISFLVAGFKVMTGITDYTLALAKECLEQKHVVQILALNAISSRDEAKIVNTFGGDILRTITTVDIPLAISDKVDMIEQHLQSFDPDWISIQFQYQYFRQGSLDSLSYLARFLRKQKSKGRMTNIFVHEIWQDPTDIDALKNTFVRRIKRLVITNFLKSSKADLILTSNTNYVDSLQASGISSKQLPVLNTIPICSKNLDLVNQEIHNCSGLDLMRNRLKYCMVGILEDV